MIAGDETSYSLLFKKYFPIAISYGKSLLSDHDKVQDCIQDVFVDIWIYRNSLSREVIVKAYVLASVRKRIARLHKRDQFFKKTVSIDSVSFYLDFRIENELIFDSESAIRVKKLNLLVNNLPSRQKEALYLRYHQSLSVEQIAVILDVNYQSAINLLHRSLLKLRQEGKNLKQFV
ncbi:sigma-70 family RNA polymerase sigma factor [Flavobacterium psychroterrae]|uniref:Sigma-70 family RNA polymerase sigma factor n=2 Tax=Flavobacterium psychroterrae TaxID=2133767 RepID=A0ABS5PIU3_9FLAO|nr:sigma-70 family RNA polymerase sigma factor [Flavobacterium psychroterrae]